MNTTHTLRIFLLFVLLPAADSSGQSASTDAPDPLARFSWMEGAWQGHLDTGNGLALAETQYFAPRGGKLSGSFRLTMGGQTMVLELFSLVASEDGIELRVRHFGTDLTPWEQGDPIILTMESATDSLITFRNHINDNPRWSWIHPMGGDQFRGRSQIVSATGATSEIDILYSRVHPGR